jgi:2-polyprenyl-3-methyl-5-hydroxy-6-metoxy-1,4-benzoquinol methylase
MADRSEVCMPESHPSHNAPAEILGHYQAGVENNRLAVGSGNLEMERTREIIRRFLPPPPAVIADIGGGPGIYSGWLARLGYEVHLIDPVPLHVEQAQERSRSQPEAPIASARIGDARQIESDENSFAAVLLLGPLYHLTEQADRIAALRETARITQPGGHIFAAAISRFASLLDGLDRGFIADPAFRDIMAEDLRSGQHRNPDSTPHYFTTAYFHRPEELRAEFEAAGLRHLQTLAVEGPAAYIQHVVDQWDDPNWRDQVLAALRHIEDEPELLGASPHLLAVGQVPVL